MVADKEVTQMKLDTFFLQFQQFSKLKRFVIQKKIISVSTFPEAHVRHTRARKCIYNGNCRCYSILHYSELRTRIQINSFKKRSKWQSMCHTDICKHFEANSFICMLREFDFLFAKYLVKNVKN